VCNHAGQAANARRRPVSGRFLAEYRHRRRIFAEAAGFRAVSGTFARRRPALRLQATPPVAILQL